mgnify:CR=1 FL=1
MHKPEHISLSRRVFLLGVFVLVSSYYLINNKKINPKKISKVKINDINLYTYDGYLLTDKELNDLGLNVHIN